MIRKSTGKRLRFEVFKRDFFTCQYCGAQPPGIVLVADHIEPVAGGGETTIDNLITACEPCNQGKSDKVLTERAVRPDADLMYLEAQQEVAELRRWRAAADAKDAEMASVVRSLSALWSAVSERNWQPSEIALRKMVERYGPEAAATAVRATAPKVDSGKLRTSEWMPYAMAVARNTVNETPQETPAASATEEPDALTEELSNYYMWGLLSAEAQHYWISYVAHLRQIVPFPETDDPGSHMGWYYETALVCFSVIIRSFLAVPSSFGEIYEDVRSARSHLRDIARANRGPR